MSHVGIGLTESVVWATCWGWSHGQGQRILKLLINAFQLICFCTCSDSSLDDCGELGGWISHWFLHILLSCFSFRESSREDLSSSSPPRDFLLLLLTAEERVQFHVTGWKNYLHLEVFLHYCNTLNSNGFRKVSGLETMFAPRSYCYLNWILVLPQHGLPWW